MRHSGVIGHVTLGVLAAGLVPLTSAGAGAGPEPASPAAVCGSAFGARGPSGGPVVGEGPSGDPMSVNVAWDPGEWPTGLREIVTCLSVGGRSMPALASITVDPPNAGTVTVNFALPAGDPGTLVCQESVLIGTGSTEGRTRPTDPVCFKLRAAEDSSAPTGPGAPGPDGPTLPGRPHATPPAVMPPMTPAAPRPPARVRRPAETVPDVHPPAAHPPAVHPPAGHPPAAHPPAVHPPAAHPPAAHPPAAHPPAAAPATPATPAMPAPTAPAAPAAPAAPPWAPTSPPAPPMELARRLPMSLLGPVVVALPADPVSGPPARAALESATASAHPSAAGRSGAAALSSLRPSPARSASAFPARPLTSDGRPLATGVPAPALPVAGGAAVSALPRTGISDHIPLAGGGGLLAIGGAAIVLAEPRRRSRRLRKA
jgi:hypothetical protein